MSSMEDKSASPGSESFVLNICKYIFQQFSLSDSVPFMFPIF